MESLDVATGCAHLATTLSATKGSLNSQESQAKFRHSCYDYLNENELHGSNRVLWYGPGE